MSPKSSRSADHHCFYVVYLRNPRGDGKAGYYVGMSGLTPEQRFQNHKQGHKAAGVVKRFGERLVPRLQGSKLAGCGRPPLQRCDADQSKEKLGAPEKWAAPVACARFSS